MGKKLLFIANPVSGKKNIGKIISKIKKGLHNTGFDTTIILTERPGHAIEITKHERHNFDAIIAIGGDGTINEVASQLVQTNTSFGIIPNGSGNGLARNLKIPMNTKKALFKILRLKTKTIDCAKINGKYFFNVSGIGFDAEIAHFFNQTEKRGFLNYIQLTARKFLKYKEESYIIKFDEKEIKSRAFLISFANSNQFGNNAYINPKGKLNDGFIECCTLQRFPIYASFILAFRLFTKSIHHSKYYKFYQSNQFKIISGKKCLGHIDGDATEFNEKIEVEAVKNSLKIIC